MLSGAERRWCSKLDLPWMVASRWPLKVFYKLSFSMSLWYSSLLRKLFPLNDTSHLEAGSWNCMDSAFFHSGWSSQVQNHSAFEIHEKQILLCLKHMKTVLCSTNTRQYEGGFLCLWYKRLNEQCFVFWRTRFSKLDRSNAYWKDKKMYMSVTGLWKHFISSSSLPFLCHSRKGFRKEYQSKQIYKPLMTAVGLITTIHSRNVIPTFSNLWWLTFLKIVRRKGVVLCDIKVHQQQALWE